MTIRKDTAVLGNATTTGVLITKKIQTILTQIMDKPSITSRFGQNCNYYSV
jgi:hypothetical protein